MQGFLRVTELARFGLRFQSCKILGNWDFAQPWFANIVVTYYSILISRAHLLHRVKEPSKVLREQPPSSPDDQEPGPVSTTDHWTKKDDLLSSSSIEEEPLHWDQWDTPWDRNCQLGAGSTKNQHQLSSAKLWEMSEIRRWRRLHVS